MDKDTFKHLLTRYINDSLSPAEWSALAAELHRTEHNQEWEDIIDEALKNEKLQKHYDQNKTEDIFNSIMNRAAAYEKKKIEKTGTRQLRLRLIAVAATLLVLITGIWFWYQSNTRKKAKMIPNYTVQNSENIAPGGNKAVLILSNGTTILLDSTHNGVLAQQGNLQVFNKNGLLTYNAKLKAKSLKPKAKIKYNTIATPRGGQYKVVLPDGTKVWLNAASSLHYPVKFSEERIVTLTGEAYFEVNPLPASPKGTANVIPFIVKVGGMKVKVLGTHFNINAYAEEPVVKTTLLEGKVKVLNNENTMILEPGDQVVQYDNDQMVLKEDINTKAATAWKNGLFMFKETGIKSVMRQLARWYDIEVVYADDEKVRLSGMISRNTPLSEVLKMLELTRIVHFEVEGKKIIVSSNL